MTTNQNKYKQLATNINKLKELYGMQTHTAIEVETLLTKYLPFGYTKTIKERAASKGLSLKGQRIRSVKSLIQKDLQILNLLIEYAKECEGVAEASQKKFNSLLQK